MKVLVVYLYRFAIGLTLSSVIIYLVKSLEKSLSDLAKYGNYSLVVYTGSFVLNALLVLALDRANYHTNQMIVIDVLSIAACLAIYSIMVIFSNHCRKNKITRLLFLGE